MLGTLDFISSELFGFPGIFAEHSLSIRIQHISRGKGEEQLLFNTLDTFQFSLVLLLQLFCQRDTQQQRWNISLPFLQYYWYDVRSVVLQTLVSFFHCYFYGL